MAAPKSSSRCSLTLGGPSSAYIDSVGLPLSSSLNATIAVKALSSMPAASASRGGSQSSGQFSTAYMKPSAQTCANAGRSARSISPRSSGESASTAPRVSTTSGWKVRSSSSVSTGESSAIAISAQRRRQRPTNSMCAIGRNASPSSTGQYSSAGSGRRMHTSAARKPSQNSHWGISSSCSRSRSSSASIASKSSASSSAGCGAGIVVKVAPPSVSVPF